MDDAPPSKNGSKCNAQLVVRYTFNSVRARGSDRVIDLLSPECANESRMMATILAKYKIRKRKVPKHEAASSSSVVNVSDCPVDPSAVDQIRDDSKCESLEEKNRHKRQEEAK